MAGADDADGGARPTGDDGASDVVWLRTARGRAPARAEPLTVARIVTAAVAELDAHGAERLTMRRLAQRLEVTSTALYWHVSTKEDLLDLALDQAVGEAPIPATDTDPRAALRLLLIGWRATMLAHPWSPGLLGRPLLGPNVLARTEFLQTMLVRSGLTGIDLAAATKLLADFLIGAATTEATRTAPAHPALLARAREHILGLEELYPALATSGFVDRTRWSADDLFGLALDRVLDAIGL